MKSYLTFLTLIFITGNLVVGQSTDSSSTYPSSPTKYVGTSTIEMDRRIDKLSEKFNRLYETPGYRIMIYSAPKREDSRKFKSKFKMHYPDVNAYEEYKQPNYNVKIGDFLEKHDAYRFHKEVKIHFPYSYIIRDFIYPERN